MPALRSILLLLLGLAAFVATSVAFGSVLPWPEALGLRQKVEYFEEHEDEYDLVYVGSSFILRSFIPELIDEELAAAGRPLRSYNLGVPAMTSFETDHLLRRLVARRPQRLKWVVLEPDQWFPLGPNDADIVTRRNAGWHSLRQSRNVIAFLWREPVSRRTKLQQTWGHLALLGRHLTAYGRGPELFDLVAGRGPRVAPFSDDELAVGRGYQALDQLVDQQGRRLQFEREGADWERRIQALAGGVEPEDLPPREIVRKHFPGRFHVASVEEQVSFLRRHGIEPVYVLPPTTLRSPPGRFLARGGYLPRLLTFDDPLRDPEIYLRENFFDLNHLNHRGAGVFSRRFGRELAALLQAEAAAGPQGGEPADSPGAGG